jgi:hypothetical protein
MRRSRPEPGSGLPAPYEDPWRRLGAAAIAVLASLGLRLRELWRRNGQGDVLLPRWWPRGQASLFWPLLLALLVAVLSLPAGVMLARRRGATTPVATPVLSPAAPAAAPAPEARPRAESPPAPPPAPSPPPVSAPALDPAAEGEPAGPSQPPADSPGDSLADPSADSSGDLPADPSGDLPADSSAELPADLAADLPSRPSNKTTNKTSKKTTKTASDSPAPPPTSPRAPAPGSGSADPAAAPTPAAASAGPVDGDAQAALLLRALLGEMPPAWAMAVETSAAEGLLRLRLAAPFAALPLVERQRLADGWLARSQDLGYERLELVDGRDRPLGRPARVGSGMILLDSSDAPR